MKIMAPPVIIPASAPHLLERFQNSAHSTTGPNAAPNPAQAKDTISNTELFGFDARITPTMEMITTVILAIFTEAFLAFVGLGIPAPMASLGTLISDSYKSFTTHPYMILSPLIVLALLMLSFNLVADGLRDALDPKQKDM